MDAVSGCMTLERLYQVRNTTFGQANGAYISVVQSKVEITENILEWAQPDSNRRPSACEANVITARP
jgi:hypothetical protein